mgnify:FL=1
MRIYAKFRRNTGDTGFSARVSGIVVLYFKSEKSRDPAVFVNVDTFCGG